LDPNDRWEDWDYAVPSCIIDTFTVVIQKPVEEGWEFYIGKNTFGVKFEIVCSIGNPRVIWCAGPYKGAANDATIAKDSGIKGITREEAIAGDKIYKHDKLTFLVPLSGHRTTHDDEEKSQNYVIYAFRQSIERVIK
jgi:hypothetical protein